MGVRRGSTIAAIATPPGPGRRGILRVSGPAAAELVRAVLRGDEPPFSAEAERAVLRGRFDDGRGEQPLLVLWMRAPRSYTREDVAEFHLPGAEPLLAAAYARLLALGAVPARPGEFTRRAFLNGRLELPAAEGVLALTRAGNEAERSAALLLLDGGLERHTGEIREALLDLVALCEASLDFDETEAGHVPEEELASAWQRAGAALDRALAWDVHRAPPSALPRVVLVGAPNAGKSSLWNALTGGRALVSPQAGTTRDALEGTWNLGHGACLLIDGPGWDRAARGAGAGAQELFARVQEKADARLLVTDTARPGADQDTSRESACPELCVWNKIDLVDGKRRSALAAQSGVPVSARTGEGLVELARAVEELLQGSAPGDGGVARTLFARHREALARSRAELDQAGEHLRARAPLDLVAEALRGALSALEDLTGRATAEDVLDRIFARFCLGK